MHLKFSHVDILVTDLTEAVAYYKRIFGCTPSATQVWNRDGFHVEFVVMFKDETRFMLVHPITGNLKTMLDSKGPGTIYRYCFTTPDMRSCYEELVTAGVQPENENGVPLPVDQLKSPVGTPTIWLPKVFGDLSMEILEEEGMEESMAKLRAEAQ